MNYLLSVFLAVISIDARAEAAACSPLASPQGVFDCLMKTHPLAKSADALVAQSEALEAAAAQRPNPEAASNAVFGNSQDQIEVSVLHTIETGGKRARRLDRAKAEALELRAEALATKEEIAVGSAVALFRLRQIREELKLLVEASETFATIAKQLKQRPRRSPEQEVSLSVFQLAGRDYSVRRAGLESEEANLRRQLEFGLGAPLPATDTVLPERPSQWPDPGGAKDPASYRGSAALHAAAAVEVAKAGVAAANAEAYPDIRVGPSLLNQKNGAGQGQATLFGAGLSLPLPLYHRNGGVRKLAVKSAETAALRSSATNSALMAARDAEVARYRAATAVLSRAEGHAELESQHEQMEGLFERGLIPASLVIEAHRQIVDYTRDINEQEALAIRALWTIYSIEGRALTEKL